MNPPGSVRAALVTFAALTALSAPARPGGAYLGVAVQPAGPTLEHQLALPPSLGLLVEQVEAGGPADRAGLRPHDILLQLNGQLLFVPQQLDGLLRGLAPDAPVFVDVMRGRATNRLEVMPAVRRSTIPEPSPIRVTVVRAPSGIDEEALAGFLRAAAETQPARWTESPPLDSYLGLRLAPAPPAVLAHLETGHTAGAVVLAVAPGSPAEAASLQAHDVIVQVDRQPLVQPNDLFESMRTLQPQDRLRLTVLRQNRALELSVRLAAPALDRPPDVDRTAESQRRDLPPLAFATDAEWMVVVKPLPDASPIPSANPALTDPPTVVVEGTDMTIRLEGDADRRLATITDPRGSLLFQGGISTLADRLRMPPNIWARVAELIDASDLSPRAAPQLESDELPGSVVPPDWL